MNDKYLEYLENMLELLELAKNNDNIVNLTRDDILRNIEDVKNKIEEYKLSLV